MYKIEEVVKHHGGYLVRVFQGIDGFRARYKSWPTKLCLGKAVYKGLSEHLTDFGLRLLQEKIQIEIDANDVSRISACDADGRSLEYGWYGESPDIDTYQWLGVEKL